MDSDTSVHHEPIQLALFSFENAQDERCFRGSVALKVAGITYRQLDYWVRKKIIIPSVKSSHGSGSRRLFALHDIAIMAVAKRLLDIGMNLSTVASVMAFLYEHTVGKLAHATLLIDGSFVQIYENVEQMRDRLAQGSAIVVLALAPIIDRVNQALTSEPAWNLDDVDDTTAVPAKKQQSVRRSRSYQRAKSAGDQRYRPTLFDDEPIACDPETVLANLAAQVEPSNDEPWQLIQETWG